MSPSIFIDGEHGTTGLQIRTRLEERKDINLMSLAAENRRNVGLRRQMLNEADLVIPCLPDDASRESVSMIDNPLVKVIDASTAHPGKECECCMYVKQHCLRTSRTTRYR